jgi:O-antigen/teichoic acid export membrane protein
MMVYKKIASTFVSKVIAAACNLLLLYITIRFMGAEVRGNISLLILNLSFIMIFSEWIAGPVLVYFFANNNTQELLLKAYAWILSTTILVFIIFNFISIPYSLQAFTILCFVQCSISLHNQVLIAFGKITHQNFIQLIQPILTLVLVLVHIKMNATNIEGYLHSYLVASIITYVIQLIFYAQLSKKTNGNKVGFIALAKTGGYTTATNIAHLVTNRVSYFYINTILGATALGIYSTSISLAETILMAASSAGLVHYSVISNSSNHDFNILQTKKFAKYSILITLFLFVIVFFIPNQLFVTIFGKDFNEVKYLILLYSLGIFSLSLTLVYSHFFSGIGNFKVPFIAGLTSCIVTGTFAKTALLNFGQEGILVLTSVSLVIQFLILYYYFKKSNQKQS